MACECKEIMCQRERERERERERDVNLDKRVLLI